jgi:hypothetical protein
MINEVTNGKEGAAPGTMVRTSIRDASGGD